VKQGTEEDEDEGSRSDTRLGRSPETRSLPRRRRGQGQLSPGGESGHRVDGVEHSDDGRQPRAERGGPQGLAGGRLRKGRRGRQNHLASPLRNPH